MPEILEEELPGRDVSTSGETLPEIFEHERFSTTVANAVLSPLVAGYVERLEERLKDDGYEGDLLILHSGGGVMTAERGASASPCGSPPRASPRAPSPAGTSPRCAASRTRSGSTWAARAPTSRSSTTASCAPRTSGSSSTATRSASRRIEVLTIGAGGGSLAWIDAAGSLRNGPQSAGADPGPACYGNGGEEPTNTDANVVLGRLGGELVGGGMTLDRDAAAGRDRERIGEPLGLDVARGGARAIIAVANANMADAVRLISIRRGYDPREFALVVFGGAGAAARRRAGQGAGHPDRARAAAPGTWSALGCLMVDIRHDLSRRCTCAAPTTPTRTSSRRRSRGWRRRRASG